MTEAEWSTCTDPTRMLALVRGRFSERKVRLFACACCRHVWDHFETHHSRPAVVVAERYADGLADRRDLDAARAAVLGALETFPCEPVFDPSYWACDTDDRDWLENCAFYACSHAAYPLDGKGTPEERYGEVRAAESAVQASFLRDIFGNPFSPVVAQPRWFTPTVIGLAGRMYGEPTFDRMSDLSDALEEAGCADADVLDHCRAPGPHVRGCWVVDMILGKS